MNRIPKNFYRVTARATEDADESSKGAPTIKSGDLLEIYRNDFGLLTYNHRDSTYYYIGENFYRDCLKVLEVVE